MIEHDHHGNSVAAWTAVALIIAGSVAAMLGVVFAQMSLVWVAVVLVVLGIVAGKVLAMAGYGVNGKRGAST